MGGPHAIVAALISIGLDAVIKLLLWFGASESLMGRKPLCHHHR